MQSTLGFITQLSARRIGALALLFALVGALSYFGLFAFQVNIGMHSWLSALQIWKNDRHHLVECAELTFNAVEPTQTVSCASHEQVFESHESLRDRVREGDWAGAKRDMASIGLTEVEAEAAIELFDVAYRLPPAASAVEVWTGAISEIGELRELIGDYQSRMREGGVSRVEQKSYLRQLRQIEDQLDVHEARFEELLETAAPKARYVAVGSIFLALFSLVCTGLYLARLAGRFEQKHQHVERRLARHEAKMLEADRMIAVGMLAAGVGHEINNPLTYVAGGIDFAHLTLSTMLEQDDLERDELGSALAEVVEALEDAREGTNRVRDIVRDLRTFSRRADPDKLEQIRLVPILDLALDMAAHEIRHRARLVRDYTEELITFGNESRLAQVFLNLVINAAQAIEEGDVDGNEIRVLTYRDDDQVVVEVHDTGKGITEAQRELVFEPFRTTKAEGEGTGLGLAISRNIVESMGGTLTFESTPGEHTTFTVRLPVAEGT